MLSHRTHCRLYSLFDPWFVLFYKCCEQLCALNAVLLIYDEMKIDVCLIDYIPISAVFSFTVFVLITSNIDYFFKIKIFNFMFYIVTNLMYTVSSQKVGI